MEMRLLTDVNYLTQQADAGNKEALAVLQRVARALPGATLLQAVSDRVGDDLLTVPMMARQLGRTEDAVRKYIRSGLPAAFLSFVGARGIHLADATDFHRWKRTWEQNPRRW
jgi:hypothetical protein